MHVSFNTVSLFQTEQNRNTLRSAFISWFLLQISFRYMQRSLLVFLICLSFPNTLRAFASDTTSDQNVSSFLQRISYYQIIINPSLIFRLGIYQQRTKSKRHTYKSRWYPAQSSLSTRVALTNGCSTERFSSLIIATLSRDFEKTIVLICQNVLNSLLVVNYSNPPWARIV